MIWMTDRHTRTIIHNGMMSLKEEKKKTRCSVKSQKKEEILLKQGTLVVLIKTSSTL